MNTDLQKKKIVLKYDGLIGGIITIILGILFIIVSIKEIKEQTLLAILVLAIGAWFFVSGINRGRKKETDEFVKATKKYRIIVQDRLFRRTVIVEGIFSDFEALELNWSNDTPWLEINLLKKGGKRIGISLYYSRFIWFSPNWKEISETLLNFCEFFQKGFILNMHPKVVKKLYSKVPELARSKWNRGEKFEFWEKFFKG